MERLADLFFDIPAAWAVGAIFVLTCAEASLFFGFVIPGEIAVVLGGVLASQGRLSLGNSIVAAVSGAVLGDLIGYSIGRRYGAALLERRFPKKWPPVRDWLARRGAPAVFFGRTTAFLRAVVPTAAGAAKMPLPRFLFWNLLGGVTWGAGFTLLGYVAGEGYETALHWAGRGSLALLVLIAVVALFALAKHRWVQRVTPPVG